MAARTPEAWRWWLLTLLPLAWRVTLLPLAIALTPAPSCASLACVALDAGLVLLLIAPFAALARWRGECWAGLGLPPDRWRRGLLVGALGALAIAIAIWFLTGALLPPLEEPSAALLLLRPSAAAAGEELAYRGYVQRRLAARFGTPPAIATASLLFALGHVPAIALDPGGDITALAAYVVGGLVLGGVFALGGSAVAPALVHAAYNGLLLSGRMLPSG